MGRILKVLICGDAQAPYYHEPSLAIMKKFAKDFRPDYFVDLGDRGDFRSMSRWDSDVVKADQKMRFIEDFQAFKDWGDSIHKVLPKKCKKVLLKGNHDIRPEKYVSEDPVMEGLTDISVYLKDCGYKVIPHGHYFNIGHLYFHHGDEYKSNAHSRQYATRTGKSVVYGHHHEFQSTTVHHLDQPHAAFSIGMMADKEKLKFYTQGRPSSWQNGFAYAYIDEETGYFSIYPVIVVEDRAIINGKIYRG